MLFTDQAPDLKGSAVFGSERFSQRLNEDEDQKQNDEYYDFDQILLCDDTGEDRDRNWENELTL